MELPRCAAPPWARPPARLGPRAHLRSRNPLRSRACGATAHGTGELVSRFEDHTLWFPLPEVDHTSVIFITQSQDVILSLCEESARRRAPPASRIAP